MDAFELSYVTRGDSPADHDRLLSSVQVLEYESPQTMLPSMSRVLTGTELGTANSSSCPKFQALWGSFSKRNPIVDCTVHRPLSLDRPCSMPRAHVDLSGRPWKTD